jgi:hypothetical protein
MPASQLLLTADERQFLVDLLQAVLKDARIEEHRTRAPSYREHILQKETLLNSVLSKLGS